MAQPGVHEALIYIMVVMSASDRQMTGTELARMGDVVRTWPIFEDFPEDRLPDVARDCQKLLQDPDGLAKILTLAREKLPKRLHDTAYALAFEVAAADLEMRLEELRVLQLLRMNLEIDPSTIAAIERAAKARHRTLT